MKRFIKIIFTYLGILAVITLIINAIYIRLERSDSDDTEKFTKIPQNINICNFGSSHGLYAFDYEDFGDNYVCFNFGLKYQKLSYDYRLFENYKDRIDDGAIVYIPISYFSLFGADDELSDDFPERNKRYYKILPADLIKQYDWKTNIYVNYLPSLAVGENIINVLTGRSRNINDKIWSGVATDIDISANANLNYENQIVIDRFDENGVRIINVSEISALKDIIEGCYKKGCMPILITTPFLREFYDEIYENDPEFFKDFYSLVESISNETGVSYFDYSHDERFCDNKEWFRDVDHMNKFGAREFTSILLKETANIELEK